MRGSKRVRTEDGMRWPKDAVRRRLEGEGVRKGNGSWDNLVAVDVRCLDTHRPVLEACARKGERRDGETFGEEAKWG